VDVRRSSEFGETLGRLWARTKVTSLQDLLSEGPNPDVQSEITALGLKYHLVTPYTSLIAVDWSKKVGDGKPETIEQPVDAPEGVDPEMAGGRMYATGMAYSESLMVVSGSPSCLCRAGHGGDSRGALVTFGLLFVVIVVRRRRAA